MDRSSLTRRKMLTSVGAAGLASVGVLGFMTRRSIPYTKTVAVAGEDLEVDWRETYNGEVQEDTRSSESTEDGAVIRLGNVLPGDVGTVSFRLRNPEDASSTVEPQLSLDLLGTAENEVVEPEKAAGDTSDGPDEGELQDFLDTKFWYDEGFANFEELGGDNATQDPGESLITSDDGAEGTLAEVAGAVNGVSLDQLSPGDEVTVSFRWEFADDSGVGVTQTDSVNFAFILDTSGGS